MPGTGKGRHCLGRFWLIPAILLGCMPPGVYAEIYKCTGSGDAIRYSDKPCGGEETVFTPRPAPATPQPVPTTAERRAKTKRLLDAFRAERAEEKQAAAEARKTREERRKKCLEARDYYRSIREAGFVYDLDGAGNRVVMNDAERAQETAWARAEVERWCD